MKKRTIASVLAVAMSVVCSESALGENYENCFCVGPDVCTGEFNLSKGVREENYANCFCVGPNVCTGKFNLSKGVHEENYENCFQITHSWGVDSSIRNKVEQSFSEGFVIGMTVGKRRAEEETNEKLKMVGCRDIDEAVAEIQKLRRAVRSAPQGGTPRYNPWY